MSLPSSEEQIKTAADEADEEAAFEAAFNDTDVEPEVAPAKDDPQPESELPDAVSEEVQPYPVKELTVNDLRAMIEETTEKSKAQISKLGGKLGELQQKIEAAKSTVTGISPKARVKLEKDFPELAAMLFEEDEAPVVQHQTPVAPKGPTDEDIADAQEILAFDHPDWTAVVTSPEFKKWSETLPPAVSKKLNNTFDPSFVSGKLTAFKAMKAAENKPEPVPVIPDTSKEKDTEKKKRLDAAIAPKGVPRSNTSTHDDDEEQTAMLAAYSK